MTIEQWTTEIQDAIKRDKDFRKKGKEIRKIYSGEKDSPFNILYSNTEILLPALYSSVPRPAIAARYDNDPIAEAGAKACNKMIEYLLDTDLDGHDTFDSSMSAAVMDGLLPGRGISVVEYDADDEVNVEAAYLESKKWDQVLFGYAEKWSDMPWIAYEMHLSEEEAKELFDEIPAEIEFSSGDKDEKDNTRNQGVKKTALFYQIWEKEDRTVRYLSLSYKDGFLKEDSDPLELSGFFNCPEPLCFVKKTHNLIPTSLYSLYEKQAEEVNNLTVRINRITKMIKAVFLFDGSLGDDIETLVEETDGGMVPTASSASLVDGGLSKSIWGMPIAELIATLTQLVAAREAAKQVIYEIMGISDILRGSSRASETLGAQQIKESWGTMRIKRLQKDVQRYALDSMKLMLEVAISKFSVKTWAQMTGLPYTTEKQREMAELALKNTEDPKAQQLLQAPQWEVILKSLKNDTSRSYRIDIETNSTLDVEATEDKKMIGDFLNAFSQFSNAFAPMVQDGTMPFGAFKAMILSVIKRYRFGREVEEEIKAMQPPQSSPAEQKAQQEIQQEKEKLQQESAQIEQQKQALMENSQKKADEIIRQEDALEEKAVAETEKIERMQRKLDDDIQQFEFEKELSRLRAENENYKRQLDSEISDQEAKLQLREQITAHTRDIQSMIDRHAANVNKMMEEVRADLRPPVQEGS